jgi:hypothetical protein
MHVCQAEDARKKLDFQARRKLNIMTLGLVQQSLEKSNSEKRGRKARTLMVGR